MATANFLKPILMKSFRVFLFIIGTFTAVSCQNETATSKKSEDTIPDLEAILPHGSDVKQEELSEADLKKIAQAKGKTVEMVTFDQLSKVLNNTGDELIVCNFWATWCKPCIEEMPFFDRLQDEFEEDDVRVIFVSIDKPEDKEKVTTFVRQKQVRSEVMQINEANSKLKSWFPTIKQNWTGDLPATIFLQTDGDVRTFYSGAFESYEELRATLYPLL